MIQEYSIKRKFFAVDGNDNRAVENNIADAKESAMHILDKCDTFIIIGIDGQKSRATLSSGRTVQHDLHLFSAVQKIGQELLNMLKESYKKQHKKGRRTHGGAKRQGKAAVKVFNY